MKRWQISAGFVVLPFLLVVTSCSSSRKQVQVSVIEPPQTSDSVQELVPAISPDYVEPEYFERDRQRAVEAVLRDANLLFDRGRELFERGEFDRARLLFGESLDLLENSGFAFDSTPRLEHSFHSLSSEVKRMEILRLAGADRESVPDFGDESSPLDEIGALDLYSLEVDPKLEALVSEDIKETQFDFPIVINQQVLKLLDFYHRGRGRKGLQEALLRSGRYLKRFREIFAEEGVPQDLVFMAHVESNFKPRAYSKARARGIWQFMAGTARLYGLKVDWWLDERLDVFKATRSAARHLRDLNTEFGDWYLALAAYNGGPGRVSRVLKRYGPMDYWTMADRRLLPRETRAFVPSILAAIIVYKHPEKYGFFVEPDQPLRYGEVSVRYQLDLAVLSEFSGIDEQVLADLNPALVRQVTPYDSREYDLKVPLGLEGLVEERLAGIPSAKRLRLKHHRVTSGETLSRIAARYGVPIQAIAEVNRIGNINRLSLNQDLMIPLSYSSGRGAPARAILDSEKHVVRSGESLHQIARHYRLRLEDLFRWNGLSPGDLIHPGQEIRLSDRPVSSIAGGE